MDVETLQRLERHAAACRASGRAQHGSIQFQAHEADVPCARYLVVDKDHADAGAVADCLQCWLPERPLVLLSVTGGAASLALDPRLEEILLSGLASATRSARAWIIDGGTDAGVMGLVGRAFAGASE